MIKDAVIKNLFRGFLAAAFAFGLTFVQTLSVQAAFGDPDPTFGVSQSGKINDVFLQYNPQTIAQQADGKILVAGERMESGKYVMVLRRYNANGSVDFSFGNNGTAVYYNTTNGYGNARHIIIQNDGKIIVAGSVTLTYAGTNQTFQRGVVWRFHPNGFYDLSWGSSGRLLLIGSHIYSIAAYQPTGSFSQNIFALVSTAAPDDYLLYRLLPNGSLDTAFGGGDGIKEVSRDGKKLLVNADGLYLLTSNGYVPEVKIFKYAFNGLPYRSFGTQGVFTGNPLIAYGCYDGQYQSTYYTSFAIQNDGKIVAGGHNQVAPLNGSSKGLIARHYSNGDFDLAFNMIPCFSETFNFNSIGNIKVSTNDEIFFQGWTSIYRRTPDNFPNGNFQPFLVARDYLIQPDAKIVAVGWDGTYVQLSRYLP